MTECLANAQTRRTARLNDLAVAAGYEDILRLNGLTSLDAMFAVAEGELLSKPGLSSWRERVRLTLAVTDASEAGRLAGDAAPPSAMVTYLKRYRSPPREAVRGVRRSGTGAASVAGVEWEWLHRLRADGIPCPKPIALGEEVTASRERRSALLLEAVPGASLERWMTDRHVADRATVLRLIGPTAALIARLHRSGYVHRDLYLSHLFFDPCAGSSGSLHLIDAARVLRPPRGGARWIVKDLASLNFSTPWRLVSGTDRIRWLKSYLLVPKLDAATRRLVYRVIGKTARIAGHERRRRARLRSGSER